MVRVLIRIEDTDAKAAGVVMVEGIGSRQPHPSANEITPEQADDNNHRLSGAMQDAVALRSGGAI